MTGSCARLKGKEGRGILKPMLLLRRNGDPRGGVMKFSDMLFMICVDGRLNIILAGADF